MTSTLLKKVERLRYLAILLLSLCAFGTANAQLSSDEINEAILVDGSIAVEWINDPENPWIISEDGSYIRIPFNEGEMSTTLTMIYNSKYPIDLKLDWYFYRDNYDSTFKVIVDGIERQIDPNGYWQEFNHVLPNGSHRIDFIVEMINPYNSDYFVGIKEVAAKEYKELETACLMDGSLPLTFVNDKNHLWLTEDGYIRSKTENLQEASSSISTTFTIDKPSLFAFEWMESQNGGYTNKTIITIDGVEYKTTYNNQEWKQEAIVLYPGEHTVEFENWHDGSYFYYEYNDGAWTMIRNVMLHQNWYNVTLNNPGELSVRLLQALEGKNLQDAELVKINGSMNSDDWSTVSQLSGAKAIDFTNTNITTIPDEGMRGLAYLSTVMLPSTLKRIGHYAFYETNFHQIDIPASVEEIGYHAWSETPLQFITFAEDSKLKKIGHEAFAYTRLIEFYMPDSVTEAGRSAEEHNSGYWYEGHYDGWDVLAYCSSLKKLHISNGLTTVPNGVAYYCTALEEVNIPANATAIERTAFQSTNIKSILLPESLTKIGEYAFAYSSLESLDVPAKVAIYGGRFAEGCENLKEVKLSSHCWNMYYDFNGCTSLQKVTLPCATPPAIESDPFYSVTKSNIELCVPDFAVEAYKADPYWYGFTNIKASDEASVNDYWAIRGNLTLDANHVIQGTPSIEMIESGILSIDSDSPQKFNEIVFNTSESNPSVFLSRSNNVTANKVESRFYVNEPNTWYFFSPVTDVNMADVTYPATDSWVIRYYDGARRANEDTTSGNWVNVPANGTLKSGQGYIIQAISAGWLYLPAASAAENTKFIGSNDVTKDLADNACETEANAGWNFVANPYPTYYDIYYIDMQAPITIWDGRTYRAYSLNDGDRGDDTFVLRPMQPFFVQKATADLSTGMPLVGRQVNTTIDRTRAPRPVVKDENRQKLNLELYCNDNETSDDYTRVVLNEQASLAYETVRDASKFMSMDANVAQLYTLGDNNHPMAINERPYENGNVALGVLLPATNRTYRISAQRADRKAWLYDAETGTEFDLTDGDYIFSASKTGIDNKRFSIRFAPASSTSVDGINEAIKVAGNVGSISVTAPAGATVAIFGTDGSVIANTMVENGNLEIEVAGGVYVVKVNGDSYKTIVK